MYLYFSHRKFQNATIGKRILPEIEFLCKNELLEVLIKLSWTGCNKPLLCQIYDRKTLNLYFPLSQVMQR